MNVLDKLRAVKQAVDFILAHDDAPISDLELAVKQIVEHASEGLKRVPARREAMAAAERLRKQGEEAAKSKR